MRLTQKAQCIVSEYLRPGGQAVDATAGNGHDTLFLARTLGPGGKVFAFDIQPQALAATATRLEEAGLSRRVTLVHRGHEHLENSVPPQSRQHIQAVMFNLGYLPGSDKTTITCRDNTLAALEQARRVLAPGGIISVLAYRGHAGGQEESLAVQAAMTAMADDDLKLSVLESPGPVLLVLAPRIHD
ncbi:tRNA (mnm(5)s(2)U34)-methyltransferase [Thiolapillus sp.]